MIDVVERALGVDVVVAGVIVVCKVFLAFVVGELVFFEGGGFVEALDVGDLDLLAVDRCDVVNSVLVFELFMVMV